MKKTRTKPTGKGVKNAVDAIKAETLPPSPWDAIPVDHPVIQSFMVDHNFLGANFYDVDYVQWILDVEPGTRNFFWKTLFPGVQRSAMPPELRAADLDKVPGFLVSLASACGLDHELEVPVDPSLCSTVSHGYHTVMCPVGDTRIKGKGLTVESPALTSGTFLLLPEPELLGMIAAFPVDVDVDVVSSQERHIQYGLTVFRLPRVLRLITKSSRGRIKV
jgi:hypothetical protein